VLHGRAYEEIAAESSRLGAQLVVVGRKHDAGPRGHTSDRRGLRAVRQVPNVVLSVAINQPWRPLSRIFFATDLVEAEWGATRWVARLAGSFGAEVTVMHVSDPDWRPLGPSALAAPLLDGDRQADVQALEDLAGFPPRVAAIGQSKKGMTALRRTG